MKQLNLLVNILKMNAIVLNIHDISNIMSWLEPAFLCDITMKNNDSFYTFMWRYIIYW